MRPDNRWQKTLVPGLRRDDNPEYTLNTYKAGVQ